MVALVLLGTLFLAAIALTGWQSYRERRHRLEQEGATLAAVQARVAERVVDLFAAVDRARTGSGRTAAAFAAVERAFHRASEAYARACEQAEAVRELIARGDLAQVRQEAPAAVRALEAVLPLLDELEAALRALEQQWTEAEHRIEEMRGRLAAARRDLAAIAEAGVDPSPLARQLDRMEQFLAEAAADLRKDNPVAALQKAEDLAIRLDRVAAEIDQYRSAAVAIRQARDEVAALRAGSSSDPQAATWLQEAEERLAACTGHLAAGRLDHLQADLLHVQNCLRQVRRLRKEKPPVP